jgi:hypothetical protein
MRPLEQLTAENILSVKLPESLFSRSPGEAKHEYRILARRWHPDHQNEPEAVRVFVHIVELYGLARKKLAAGDWDTSCEKIEDQKPGLHRFRLTDNSVKTCRYRACRQLNHIRNRQRIQRTFRTGSKAHPHALFQRRCNGTGNVEIPSTNQARI